MNAVKNETWSKMKRDERSLAGAVVDIWLHFTEAVKSKVADETSISKVGVEL